MTCNVKVAVDIIAQIPAHLWRREILERQPSLHPQFSLGFMGECPDRSIYGKIQEVWNLQGKKRHLKVFADGDKQDCGI